MIFSVLFYSIFLYFPLCLVTFSWFPCHRRRRRRRRKKQEEREGGREGDIEEEKVRDGGRISKISGNHFVLIHEVTEGGGNNF